MKKQLLITLIFLIISLSVLGVASYAWYSSNIVVQAQGISLSVNLPVNVMASLYAAQTVTSLDNFKTCFEFGSAQTNDGDTTISEYDMLIPVTSSNGVNFLYLPFRSVGPDGCPKEGITVDDYLIIPESASTGYFIDIPLYLITTTPVAQSLYVSYIDIGNPMESDESSMIYGAVRCAVLQKKDDAYRQLIVAKDQAATPLVGENDTVYYPIVANGTTAYYTDSDPASYESDYYTLNPTVENPYLPSETNTFVLEASKKIDNVYTYYTTELHLRVWVEGSDANAVYQNAGNFFSVTIIISVNES